MKSQQPIEEQLWEYIDGTVAPKDRLRIEGLLQSQAEWKKKYNELLEISQLLQSTELESPSLRFSKNVMEEIARLQITPATKSTSIKRSSGESAFSSSPCWYPYWGMVSARWYGPVMEKKASV